MSTSCLGAHEFSTYHEYLWRSKHSTFRTSGTVLQKMDRRLGMLTMRYAFLERGLDMRVHRTVWHGLT